jgi:hypothetical protein
MKKNDSRIKEVFDKNIGLVGFIPHSLAIENRHELDVFPLNVMFAKEKETEAGGVISAYSLYEPLINSYTVEGNAASMEYINIYSHSCYLKITYDYVTKSYTGDKYVKEKLVLSSVGPNWKTFFFHFTMLGLSLGERCKYE